MSRPVAFVVSCEHAGNRVPPRYRHLFRGGTRDLRGHRGYDPGALDMARYLARALGAPLEYSTVTRLLVDLNRSIGHRGLFSEFSRALGAEERSEIVRRFYAPHRERVEGRIRRLIESGHIVVHVASHTFTPVLDGDTRSVDIAWLYDPRRSREKRFCRRSRDALESLRPDLRQRRNYPYRGTADGLTVHLRKVFAPTRYLGIELEVNQRWFFGERDVWMALRRSVAKAVVLATKPTGSARDLAPGVGARGALPRSTIR